MNSILTNLVAILAASPAAPDDNPEIRRFAVCAPLKTFFNVNERDDYIVIADLDAALGIARNCVASGDPLGHLSEAYVLVKQGNVSLARAAIGRANALGQDPAMAARITCMIERAANNLPAARSACDRALSLRPNWVQALASRAEIARIDGDMLGALRYIEQALRGRPEGASLLVMRAELLLALGRKDEAVSTARRAVQSAPIRGETHNILATSLIAVQEYEGAIAAATRSIEVAPGFPDAWSLRAEARYRSSQDALAAADAARAIAINPTHERAYWVQAMIDRQNNRMVSALAAIDRAVAINPESAAAHHERGFILERLGRSREAEVSHRRASMIDPRWSSPWVSLSAMALVAKDYPKAESLAREAISRDDRSANGHGNLAAAVRAQGRLSEALEHYDRALALRPNLEPSLFWRARTLSELGRPTAAIADYSKLVEVNPRYGWAWVNRGQLYLEAGNATAAWNDLNHIIGGMRTQSEPWVLWHLAGTRSGQSNTQMLDRLGQIWPSMPNAGALAVRANLRRLAGYPLSSVLEDVDAARSMRPTGFVSRYVDAATDEALFDALCGTPELLRACARALVMSAPN